MVRCWLVRYGLKYLLFSSPFPFPPCKPSNRITDQSRAFNKTKMTNRWNKLTNKYIFGFNLMKYRYGKQACRVGLLKWITDCDNKTSDESNSNKINKSLHQWKIMNFKQLLLKKPCMLKKSKMRINLSNHDEFNYMSDK